ncbi:MAG: methylmalonyl Co-A mutase-associated GTPase MeaB [Candidatus Dormibacteria bacterium]
MDVAALLPEGDVRALARAIRMVEDRDPGVPLLLQALRGRTAHARVVGITGPPGAGKSTVCDGVITRWRAAGHRVGVIAVDPSSPFSGGAILGDRVRMQRHARDPGVYIRSMAARGHLGGLASAAREAIRLVDASGRDRCLLETVGVGQSELEVMQTADTTVVVTTPASGDAVQIIKAGILEIADIFVVNKSDLPGAPRVAKELRQLVHASVARHGWEIPVISAQAATGEGLDELTAAILQHGDQIASTGELGERRAARLRAEVEAIVIERASERARRMIAERRMIEELDPSAADPYALADRILSGFEDEESPDGKRPAQQRRSVPS